MVVVGSVSRGSNERGARRKKGPKCRWVQVTPPGSRLRSQWSAAEIRRVIAIRVSGTGRARANEISRSAPRWDHLCSPLDAPPPFGAHFDKPRSAPPLLSLSPGQLLIVYICSSPSTLIQQKSPILLLLEKLKSLRWRRPFRRRRYLQVARQSSSSGDCLRTDSNLVTKTITTIATISSTPDLPRKRVPRSLGGLLIREAHY